MTPSLPPSRCKRIAQASGFLFLVMMLTGWGFTPHRVLHSVAWNMTPTSFRDAWGSRELDLAKMATAADSRKHTDTLEAPRHYLDIDLLVALPGDSLPWEWAKPWSSVQAWRDSLDWKKDPGQLPWHMERTYRLLVWALNDSDKTPQSSDRAIRLAADLGHYIADAHVPLHTSSNYDGQQTGQRGIHALWETHAMEWHLKSPDRQPCSPIDWERTRPFDPTWDPWTMLAESHALVDGVLQAEREWKAMLPEDAWSFQRRGRTMQLIPTGQAMALWDSLTHHTTTTRFCLASQRIALAWHSAWVEAGRPLLAPPPSDATSDFPSYLQGMMAKTMSWLRTRFQRQQPIHPHPSP